MCSCFGSKPCYPLSAYINPQTPQTSFVNDLDIASDFYFQQVSLWYDPLLGALRDTTAKNKGLDLSGGVMKFISRDPLLNRNTRFWFPEWNREYTPEEMVSDNATLYLLF